MSLSSILVFLCSLILAFTVLSAGQAKLTGRITEEVHAKYLAKEKETASKFIPLSPAEQRQLVGVIDIICGLLLLVPSWRSIGAAAAFALLAAGLVPRVRRGESIKPAMILMGLSATVWIV